MVIYFMSFGEIPKDQYKLLNIKSNGIIRCPKEIDAEINQFIKFCIKKPNQYGLCQRSLKEDLQRCGILFH